MKFLIVFVALFALALAAPDNKENKKNSISAAALKLAATVPPRGTTPRPPPTPSPPRPTRTTRRPRPPARPFAPADIEIVRSDSEVGPESFNYAFETSDGTQAQADGQLKNTGTEQEAISVQGSYSFVADDGQTYTVTYVADENGFQPQGAHLPVAPEA